MNSWLQTILSSEKLPKYGQIIGPKSEESSSLPRQMFGKKILSGIMPALSLQLLPLPQDCKMFHQFRKIFSTCPGGRVLWHLW
jgi:hypothetical protein